MSTSSPFGTSGDGRGVQRTIADQVATELHRLILRGHFPSGAHLRIQDLAERFDTSAMPVREALRKMAALGLVDLEPHRGARVRDLSVEDLDDTYRARLAVESYVIAEAASKFTEAQGQLAERALERHEAARAAGDIDEARRHHQEFHFALYDAAGSPWLARCIQPAWQNSERYRFSQEQADAYHDQSHREHLELLHACLAGDPGRAATAMRVHLEGALSRMRSAMTTGDHTA